MKLKHLIFGCLAVGLVSCGTPSIDKRIDKALDDFEKAGQQGDCEKFCNAFLEINELSIIASLSDTDTDEDIADQQGERYMTLLGSCRDVARTCDDAMAPVFEKRYDQQLGNLEKACKKGDRVKAREAYMLIEDFYSRYYCNQETREIAKEKNKRFDEIYATYKEFLDSLED